MYKTRTVPVSYPISNEPARLCSQMWIFKEEMCDIFGRLELLALNAPQAELCTSLPRYRI
jgi:hypothetical protein